MPNRILRDYTDSLAVDQLDWLGECLFVRLIQKADDFGRFHGNPTLVRSLLFPLKNGLRDSDISARLAACEKAGLIRVYESSGKPFIEIVNFGQRLKASTRSKYPDPPWSNFGQIPEHPGTSGKIPENPARGEDEGGDDNHTHRAHACDDPCFWSNDASSLLGNLFPDWQRWLSVWSDMHGNGRPMNEIIQQAQLEKLMRLPAEVRRDALKAAIAGGWKNIQDIRESGPVKRKGGRNRPDIATPPVFTEEDRDDDINECF